MIRLCFHALARKLLSGRPLQRTSRCARRNAYHLRLEALEDRTVTSVLNILSSGPLAAVSAAGVSYDAIDTISGDLGSALRVVANASLFGGPAFDVQTTTARDLPSHPPTIHLRLTLPGSFGGDPNLPSSVISPVPGATHFQPPPASFAPSLDPDRPQDTVTQLRLPGGTAQPDKGTVQDTSDPNVGNSTATDPCRLLQGRTAATPELQGAPTGPTTSSLHDDSGSCELISKVYRSRIPNVTVARPPRDNSDLAGWETSGVGPQARQSARVETAVPRTTVERPPPDLPDGSLLQRFVAEREQAAFTSLVQRYERLVLGVCERVLGDPHAAQDASQATFLVLARKASMLDGQRPLAGWLYQVAYHLALRLRAVAARQRRCEKRAADGRPSQDASEPSADTEKQEMRQALLEELQQMPEKYRAPLILCYFDGRTHEEAARAIGLPRGSMAKRIAEALKHLRERLLDRGFSL